MDSELDEIEWNEDKISTSQVSERSRPSTPKWWRPSYPPETYEWEEMRRKRRMGGYPWTHLDKNDEKSDNVYETVKPGELYGSGLIAVDPETTSLDRHNFYIPPELDIVSSEGLDGLDQPDPHDYGLDGDKEWSLYDVDKPPPSPKTLFAGIRNKVPKVGSTSGIRPLKQDRELTPAPLQELSKEPVDIETNIQVEEALNTETENIPNASLSHFKQESKSPFAKLSFLVRPKFKKLNFKMLQNKRSAGKENDTPGIDDKIERKLVPGPSCEKVQIRQLKIRFDDSLDLSLRESPEIASQKFEPRYPSPHNSVEETSHELESLQAEEKWERDRMLEEAKRLKMEKINRDKDAKIEIKQLKAEEKNAKAQEKVENKRLKAEEKLFLQRKEAEEKVQRQLELEETKRKDLEAVEVAKLQKELQKQLAQEASQMAKDMKIKSIEAEKLRKKELQPIRLSTVQVADNSITDTDNIKVESQSTAACTKTDEYEAVDKLEAEVMDTILKKEQNAKKLTSKKNLPSKVELFKSKLSNISLKTRLKKHNKTPPQRHSPPRCKITPLGEQELAFHYRQKIQEQIESRDTRIEENLPEHSGIADPIIYVTQPSVDTEAETHVHWKPMTDSHREEETGEPNDLQKRPIGEKIKGFGERSKSVAIRTSKRVKNKASVIGNDIRKLGGRFSGKYHQALKEIRDREEARRFAQAEKEKQNESETESAVTTPAGHIFRFKPRNKTDKESFESRPVVSSTERKTHKTPDKRNYENITSRITEALGTEFRELSEEVESREASVEPAFSTHAPSSEWESRPSSSNASFSARSREKGCSGVLEEIDSDEFFLREKGISEGEDDAEMTKFLVSELKEAFRPSRVNALSSIGAQPPVLPIRLNRKSPSPNFQTFPPERPKRKTRAGYISDFVESFEHEISDEDLQHDNAALFADPADSEDEEYGDTQKAKADMKKIEIDVRYEPVSKNENFSLPCRPSRKERLKRKPLPTQTFYFNTIAANEWANDTTREVGLLEQLNQASPESESLPKRPRRREKDKLKLYKTNDSMFVERMEPSGKPFIVEEVNETLEQGEDPCNLVLTESESQLFEDVLDDEFDGYALVESLQPPATVPRRKQKTKLKGSLKIKRKSREFPASTSVASCTFPRFTPRTFHIVPPSRPQRTYSAIRPKRPPRKKVIVRAPDDSGIKIQLDDVELRPSAVIMRDRPLPPPPRPPRPSILRMNNLDQEAVERSLGLSHYANWNESEDADGWRPAEVAVVEEICSAKNIPPLGSDENLQFDEQTIGVQTDPVTEEDFDENNDLTSSFEEEMERFHKMADSMELLPSESNMSECKEAVPELTEDVASLINPPALERRVSNTNGTKIIFPTRLHLDELEVDFLRVNELHAQLLTTDHIQGSQLSIEGLNCSGPMSVGSIQISGPILNNELPQSLSPERLYPDRTSSPSEPPPSFFELSSPTPEDPPIDILTKANPSQTYRSTDPEEDDVIDLGMRLGRSMVRSGIRAINSMLEGLESVLPQDGESEQKQKVHLQVMLCVLLLLVSAIFILTRSNTQHHHWDFYLPPNDMH